MIRGDRGPGGSILVTRLSLRARVAGRDGEGQYLRRRGKETCRDAARGLVDGWRKHGSRRHDGLEARGSLAHLVLSTIQPSILAEDRRTRTREPTTAASASPAGTM